jgi:uncharacterized protein
MPRAWRNPIRWPAAAVYGLIRAYQAAVSPALPVLFGANSGCRFAPTCSHYAAEAVREHGAVAGLWLAACRLAKCTPLHPGGLDPVPPAGRLRCVRKAPTAAMPKPERVVSLP